MLRFIVIECTRFPIAPLICFFGFWFVFFVVVGCATLAYFAFKFLYPPAAVSSPDEDGIAPFEMAAMIENAQTPATPPTFALGRNLRVRKPRTVNPKKVRKSLAVNPPFSFAIDPQ